MTVKQLSETRKQLSDVYKRDWLCRSKWQEPRRDVNCSRKASMTSCWQKHLRKAATDINRRRPLCKTAANFTDRFVLSSLLGMWI